MLRGPAADQGMIMRSQESLPCSAPRTRPGAQEVWSAPTEVSSSVISRLVTLAEEVSGYKHAIVSPIIAMRAFCSGMQTVTPQTVAIQMILRTTSKPFSSPLVYFQCHIPSFSLFQYAPDAECMPLLPIDLSTLASPPDVDCDRGGVMCWSMVQVTANL